MNTVPADRFSPELRLLLRLLRSGLGTDDATPDASPSVDVRALVALAERHRVSAFLHHRAAEALARLAPPGTVDALQRVAQPAMHRALLATAEQIRLVQTLERAGIESIAVKGLLLAQQLYGAVGIRHVGDIDLFVRVADVTEADAALQAAGLRRTRPEFPLSPRQTREFIRVKPEFEYVRQNPLMRVELLWRLEGLPPAEVENAWRTSVPAQLGAQPMRRLPPQLDALYVLQHGARHGWFRLFWLVDAALLFRDASLDWEHIMRTARAQRLERALQQAALLAADLLGVSPPPALLPRPAERPAIARLAAEAVRQIARDAAVHEGVAEWARQLRYRVALAATPRAKYAVLAPHLFSPESWRTWPLPDRFFFVYYFANPFLWLWRRWRRAT